MEAVATAHLKRIGAYLKPRLLKAPAPACEFPVKATIVIPVRNRAETIGHSMESALGQKAPFAFNVIVVDNHSTDRTTALVRGVNDPRLVHIIPERFDLGIGGCWNEAIHSSRCGRYALQLDSDDLLVDDTALLRVVEEFERNAPAMVVGSYTTVDYSLKEVPPGLVDHREWTEENGHNNILRVNGFGAPRAFDVNVLRAFGGLPNVSYGEDYAVGLRLCREYAVSRIFDSLYLCRRWEGNTDSAISLETSNRYDGYKDWLRTQEIRARRRRAG